MSTDLHLMKHAYDIQIYIYIYMYIYIYRYFDRLSTSNYILYRLYIYKDRFTRSSRCMRDFFDTHSPIGHLTCQLSSARTLGSASLKASRLPGAPGALGRQGQKQWISSGHTCGYNKDRIHMNSHQKNH